HSPAGRPQRDRRLAVVLGHSAQHLFAGAQRHRRQNRRQRQPARNERKSAHRRDHHRVHEQPGDDRRHPVQHIGRQAYPRRQPFPPISAKYSPPAKPSGTPMALANASSSIVPTIAFPMPPPLLPGGAGNWVRNARLMPPTPSRNTVARIIASGINTTAVPNPASASITALTALRRPRFMPCSGRGSASAEAHRRWPAA